VLLRDYGCGIGDRVVMLATRSALSVATIFGNFRLGSIHVPLDPKMPAARLQYILGDIEPKLIILDERHRDVFAQSGFTAPNIVLLSELRTLIESSAEIGTPMLVANLASPQLDISAYCIYTSGSTGRPKGVLIEHRSIADFLDGVREVYDATPDSRCGSFSAVHFDAFMIDMMLPLSQGACLNLYDDVVAPDLMFEWIGVRELTHFSAWGAMLGLISQAREFESTPLPHLRTVLTGADVPEVKAVQRWLGKKRGLRVINGYGPTEATCAATTHIITELDADRDEPYPIGKALKHVCVRLVDDRDEPVVMPRVRGELLIGGTQVMRGYWKLPTETDKKICNVDGVRFYRTGDICVWLPDGTLLFIGRRDDEVNIGGYRVHLNEIKRVLDVLPEVRSSEVVLVDSYAGEKILVAALVLAENEKIQDEQLEKIRVRLTRELPGYMVPRHLTALNELPKLSSGKVDRKHLTCMLGNHFERRP
jgi:amino acid adenylation domain-containing protein